MKHTFKYILIGLSLLAVSIPANAQYNTENGISTGKSVSGQDGNGNYTITLETFARGETSVVQSAAPADIVLVLDLSQSMTSAYGDAYVYEARPSQGYSYTGYGNNTYYYLHTDGEYYPVSRDGRRLTFTAGGTQYWLSGTSVVTSRPNQAAQNNTTIWTGVLYTRARGTRLDALKDAVEDFLEVIYHNDNFKDKTDTDPRDNPLGNRIAIVTFGGPQGNETTTRIHNITGNNYAAALKDVTNADGSMNSTLIADLLAETNSGINNSSHYGTFSDEGMALANLVLGAISADRKAESSRTVVLFTDGAPGGQANWSGDTVSDTGDNSASVANRCIKAAATAKTTHTASVFTVVLGNTNTQMDNYLQWTSSNYPSATGYSATAAGTKESDDYAKQAGNDLSGVFTTIAHASGGSERPVDQNTQVRDVVSSSFTIPDGFTADDVTFEVYKVSPGGLSAWTLDEDYDMDDIHAVIGMNPAGTNKMVTVEGFDYSKADNPQNSGNGNWVGERYVNGSWVWYGRKLVVTFKIKSVDGSTGGDGTNTNTSESGVYVKNADGTYTCLNNYVVPHTNLPINLVIKKTGLKHGESATFEIERCRPKNWDETKTLEQNLAALEYNVIGKPVPDGNWKNWSKVILTNKGADRAEVVKTLLALDPHFIYRVAEDNWGWAYNMTGHEGSTEIPDTSTQEVNPFSFNNEDKAGVPKHAEAVTINHFGYTIVTGEFEGEQEEHYKSSKIKTY